ncbi:hypothetical protein M8J76_000656 [Diaphorina citri]|nr:hypothetical protein M8J76_000656 [Diaphorina citri]
MFISAPKGFLQCVKQSILRNHTYSIQFSCFTTMASTVQSAEPMSCPARRFSTKSAYQYSINANNLLTREQQEFYEVEGYLVIPKLIEDEVLDECRDRFVALCEGRVDKGPMTMMKDISLAKTGAKGEYLYNKVQELVYDELLDYVESFIGPHIRAIHSMLINKPPDAGTQTSRHPLHQDLHYFPHRPAHRIVAAWTAMERIDKDNGCLFVLPRTHRDPGSLLQHEYPEWEHEYPEWEGGVNAMYHGIRGFDSHDKLNLYMERGDTVFFHPLLIHGSGTNVTKGFRKAISCHYAAADCQFIDVKGTSQENIATEIEQLALKKYGITTTFQEVWKSKSRLVRGNELMTSKL